MIWDLLDTPEITPQEILDAFRAVLRSAIAHAEFVAVDHLESIFQRHLLANWLVHKAGALPDPQDFKDLKSEAAHQSNRRWAIDTLYAHEFLSLLRQKRPDGYLDLISYLESRGLKIWKDRK